LLLALFYFFSGQAVASYLMRELLSVSEISAQLEI